MYHEGGGMHSVVTPVPAGTHEFKFVVDGEWKHSTRHPTVGDDEETMNNIRVIRGPPKNKPVAPPQAAASGEAYASPSAAGAGAAGAAATAAGGGGGAGGAAAEKKGCCVVS